MDYASIDWRDGQPCSEVFDDVYYSANNGLAESDYVFLQHNGLHQRFVNASHFIIAETGFGTGLNFALTLRLWQQLAPESAQLDYFGIEFSPLSPDDIRRAAAQWPELEDYFSEFLQQYPLPVAGRHLCCVLHGRVRLHLCFMDVCAALQNESLAVDAWYLDGFAPSRNPEIFNHHVFALLAQNSAPGASLATYSAAGFVRRGLEQAGFKVEKCKGHGNKREMITAQIEAGECAQAPGEPWLHLPRAVRHRRHALVLGAGLAGVAVAWALTRRGWRVTLVDRHAQVAAEASGNPAGLVLPRLAVDDSCDTRFYRAAFLYASTQLDRLQAQNSSQQNAAAIWCRQGVYLGMPRNRLQRMQQRQAFHPAYIQAVARDSHPGLADDTGEVYVPRAGWASPRLICQHLRRVCADALQYRQAEVAKLLQVGQDAEPRWQCLGTDDRLLAEADILVLANGVNITKFQQTQWLPIRPVRGQLTELELKQTVLAPLPAVSFEHYIAPSLTSDRSYYCGASYDLDDACESLRDADQQANFDFAEKIYPGKFQTPEKLQGRTGFRAVSDDRMPIVGPLPDLEWFEREYHDLRHGRSGQGYSNAKYLPGAYVTAAHGSRGMTSCFLSAELIAAQLESTALPLEREIVDALNPARFIIRRLKRGS